MSWLDISVPIRSAMPVWPGDPGVTVEQVMFIEKGDICNVTRLAFGAHTGTHMDAPRHFIRDGIDMGQLPLDAVLGPCRVVAVDDEVSIREEHVPADLQRGSRVLFKTPNSTKRWAHPTFQEDYVFISQGGARALVAAGVQTVGVDYLSVGGFRQDLAETHWVLLGAGVWVIEGLDLSKVEPGEYELACLPLKIPGSDGAPARAALRKL